MDKLTFILSLPKDKVSNAPKKDLKINCLSDFVLLHIMSPSRKDFSQDVKEGVISQNIWCNWCRNLGIIDIYILEGY